MKILYISCHSILEYDEVSLLRELGYDIFSAGAYAFPHFRPGMPRPGIDSLTHYPELERLASTIDSSGGSIPKELIEWADTIIFMHRPEWLEKNWEKLKHKRVIFRSIGQNVPHTERFLTPLVKEGLQIIRYSPKERNLPDFCGEDALIRFYKDDNEYKGYTGEKELVINFTQSIKQRGAFCHYNEIMDIMQGFPSLIYGTDNEPLGDKWGGRLEHEEMKAVMRESRVFIYGGTWPASYTLSVIEAMMTGIPVVALGKTFAQSGPFEKLQFYEIEDIIQNGINGFVSDSIDQIRKYVELLLKDRNLAMQIGRMGRARAIDLFGKEGIKKQWKEFINNGSSA